MRSVCLSKYLSKSVHFFTAFVYLFTFLGPSLALATSTITYTETVQEEQVVQTQPSLPSSSITIVSSGGAETHTVLPTLRLDTREAYKRYDLSVTPENSSIRQGIHFRFQNYDSPEESLGTFVNFNGPFPYSNFSPLIKKDLQTGFTVSLPEFGQIQCDWQGNLKLVGLHTTHPERPALALNLVTSGTVELSDVTLANLSLKAKKATFLKGVTIQEESVFDIKILDLASSGFENTKLMTFLSKTRFLSKQIWRNKGGILGEKSLFFDNLYFFSNLSIVHSKRYLRLISGVFGNYHGTFHGDRGTSVRAKSGFYNNYGGKITSGGLTRVAFFMANENDLSKISGQNVILEDLSGAEHFTLKTGSVTAQERVTLVGNSPQMPNVHFVTPQLVLDADGFDLGEQNDVERTLIMRSKDQNLTLTKEYKTDGALEIWQRDLYTRDAVKEALFERFGDETGEMPAPESVIELQASIKAAGGLAFFTPSAKVRLGDAAKEDLLEFTSQNGWLEAYATLFDIEKGTLVAENAHVHAPGGILTGRLVRDQTRDCFATFHAHSQCSGTHNLGGDIANVSHTFLGESINGGYDGRHLAILPVAMTNGTFFNVKNQATFKGPWSHQGVFEAKTLVMDTPKDSFLVSSQVRLSENLVFLQNSTLHLTRTMTPFNFRYYTYTPYRNGGGPATYNFISGEPITFTVGGAVSGLGAILNQGSIFHAHEASLDFQHKENDLKSGLFQRFISKDEFTSSELSSALYIRKSSRFGRKSYPSGITFAYNQIWPVPSQCIPYAWGFLQKTNNFAGAEQSFPPQTSFGTGTTVTPDERGITTIGGDFQSPAILVLIGQGSAEVGSVPTLVRQTTHTYSPLQPLVPESINLTVLTMSENLRRLMNQNPEVDTFFRFTPRFWFEPDEAQRFHAELRPFVRVKHPQGGFEALEGQALFTLTPDMLIKAVQDKTLEVLGRGNIEDNRKIDEDQILELHRNFVEYLEETGFEGADLTGALSDPNSALPWPKKPFICYTSAMNEEGVLELSPVIWLPQEMHKKSGIQTRLLLSIPMGMSFNDLLNYAQNNEMLRDSLQLLLTNNAEMIPQINRLALTYREDNGLGDDDELPPMGEITLNGKIKADDFFILNTGNVINHADVDCQDAVLMSLFGNILMSPEVKRIYRNSQNFHDQIINPARIHAEGILKIFAGKDVIFQGVKTHSGIETHIEALADILDLSIPLVHQQVQALYGKYKGTETTIRVHHHVSQQSSDGKLTKKSGGKQESHGAQYRASHLRHHAKGKITFAAVYDQYIHSWQGKKGSKSRQESLSTTTAIGGILESDDIKGEIISEDSDIILTSPQFKGTPGFSIKALNGRVEFILGRNTLDSSSMSSSQGAMWMKNTQKSESHLTFTVPTTDGPIEVEAIETLLQSIDGQHLAFLDDLDVQEGSFINQVIKELHESHSKTVQGPGMALAVVVAVVVTCCTGGAGGTLLSGALTSLFSGVVGPAMASVLATAFTAAINTCLTNVALDTMSNGGNIGKGLQQIGSTKNLKAMATSGLTAGGGKSTSVLGAITSTAIQQTTNAGINTVINGGDFGRNLVNNLRHGGASLLVDGVIGQVSGSTSGDNKTSTQPSRQPLGFGETARQVIGDTALNAGRQFATSTLAGDDPRDSLIRAMATFAAQIACQGVLGGLGSLVDALSTDTVTNENEGNRATSGEPTPEERSQAFDPEVLPQSSPRGVSRDQEFDFLSDHLPKLKQNIEYVVDKIAEQLGVIDDNLADYLYSFKGSLRSNAEDVYQCLRDAGHSIQEAWDESLKSTSALFQRGAEEIIQNDPLRSVAFPLLVPVALGAITGLGTLITGLAIQDHIERNMPHGNDTTFGHQEGFSIPEGVNDPSVETFPIPKVSDTEELPPYVAHPDDFASTRGTGGYGPYADGTIPNILSTPILDTDPQDNIFMNERGERVYIVYEKKPIDQSKGQYTGRTSGIGDINNTKDLERILRARDRNHHMNKEGYERAEIKSVTTDPLASRGQEQLGIEENGGAQSTGGTSGNRINGIAQTNPRAQTYLEAAQKTVKDSL